MEGMVNFEHRNKLVETDIFFIHLVTGVICNRHPAYGKEQECQKALSV